jgi:hypothetical protein
MSWHYPLSWAEWKEGTESMYLLQEVLEARLDAGLTLTPEEQSILLAARKVTTRYLRSGHRKPGNSNQIVGGNS